VTAHLRISLLVDHQTARPDLEMEHGLSFHLSRASDTRNQATLRALHRAGVARVASVHRTGLTATLAFQQAYGDMGHARRVGESLEYKAVHEREA